MRKQIMLWAAVWMSALVVVTIVFPAILVKKIHKNEYPNTQTHSPAKLGNSQKLLIIPVYLTKQHIIERMPLEAYVKGVVAAEMPVSFELEALKAQAIAARTYIVRRISENDFSNVPVIGAWVTDTVVHQAFEDDQQLKERWGILAYGPNMDKISQAVQETEGMIITYEGKPINATFFSTSNGFTENSEDYWGVYVPYLRSIPSPWDKQISPKYQATVIMSYAEFIRKLGLHSTIPASLGNSDLKVLETTSGHAIKRLRVNNQIFTGREVRERLGLNSAKFTWKMNNSSIQITTYGTGHDVGLSQWGANGMAMKGKTAEQIVKYYYKGVEIEKIFSITHV